MTFFNNYKEKVVKYDLINKFTYQTITQIPKLKYLILNFNLKKLDNKALITLLSSLKLITLQNPNITVSKISNVVFKIRKGQPVGCKITLRNLKMNNFLFKLINKNFPQKKLNKITDNNTYSFMLKNVLIFDELEQNYQFFKNLPYLKIHLTITKSTFPEFCYLIKSYKLLF